MPSFPSSPVTPTRHRRAPSSIDLSSASPQSYAVNGFGQTPLHSPQTPRSSYPQSPVTRQRNSQIMNGIHHASTDDIDTGDSGGGLGSLADELAHAWEDEEGYEGTSSLDNPDADLSQADHDEEANAYIESIHNIGTPRRDLSPEHDIHLSRPRAKSKQSRHRRQESRYDGSDYGNDSDLEEPGYISPNLEARMAAIESLVRKGLEENASSNDQVIQRVVESLRDLGSQSGIESGATRLITAHTSVTSHLTHQTRAFQTLIHPLLFTHFPLISTEAIDSLIPLIDEGLIPTLPLPFGQTVQTPQRPTSSSSISSRTSGVNPLLSLQSLLSQTLDLTHALRALSDSLHESRQLTSVASRRLRSARELVAELRREDEDREESTQWIEKGNWDRRLRDREAGSICRDVVSGFEAICGEWREKLFGSAAGAELAAA